MHPSGDDQLIIKQDFNIEVMDRLAVCARQPTACQNEIESAITQFRHEGTKVDILHVQNDARILLGKSVNDHGERGGGDGLGAPNSQLSNGRISQEFNVSDSLFQFVKGDQAAPEQRLAVNGGLDPLGTSIEKLDA